MINWLTIQKIQFAAELSTDAALEISIQHWTQIQKATPQELFDAESKGLVGFGTKFCACCRRFRTNNLCDECPLTQTNRECCDAWEKVYECHQQERATSMKKSIAQQIEFYRAISNLIM